MDSSLSPSKVRNELYNIENDISEFLCNELKLSVSAAKSKRSKIDDLDSYYDFLELSHSVSPYEVELVEVKIKDIVQEKSIEGKKPDKILDECFDIIKTSKKQLKGYQKLQIEKKSSNYLNNILIQKNVLNYSKSKKTVKKIAEKKLFSTYKSFDFLLVKLKVFLHLLTLDKGTREYFHLLMQKECKYLQNINQKLMLMERFILQLEFLISTDPKHKIITPSEIEKYKKDYRKLVLKFIKRRPNNYYAKLVFKMLDGDISISPFTPVYKKGFLNEKENTSLMQQIKQRHLNERLDFFNVSFNHLLNEFQNIVEAAFFERKEQNSLSIRSKLTSEGFKVKDILFVSDFFKRRNQNSISHTNYPELGFWGVSEKEYHEYKARIEPLIKRIFKEIENKSSS